MTPGCDSREDNNLSSDAEVPTRPAKTLPLSRSRSLKRDIVGTHQIFVFYSLGDVRDGFARDCPHRHPVPLMLALRDHLQLTSVFLGVLGRLHCSRQDCQEAETRPGRGGSRRQPSVSRAGFHGPGWALRESRYPLRMADGGLVLRAAQCRRPPRQAWRPQESASHLSRVIPSYPGFQNSVLPDSPWVLRAFFHRRRPTLVIFRILRSRAVERGPRRDKALLRKSKLARNAPNA